MRRVHGADHPGIVSALTAVVAADDGTITDLSTRLTGELYVLVAEVALPADTVDDLSRALAVTGEELGVHVGLDLIPVDEL